MPKKIKPMLLGHFEREGRRQLHFAGNNLISSHQFLFVITSKRQELRAHMKLVMRSEEPRAHMA